MEGNNNNIINVIQNPQTTENTQTTQNINVIKNEQDILPSNEADSPADYFYSEFTKLMMKYNFQNDKNALKLRYDITNELRKEPTQVNLGVLAPNIGNLFSSIGNIVSGESALLEEIATLKSRISTLQTKNQNLEGRILELEEEKKKKEAKLLSYDLANLFIYYHVQPRLQKGKYWRDLAQELAEKVAEREDSEIEEEDFVEWLKSRQAQLDVNIPLLDLWIMIQERHQETHQDRRSAKNQENFLKKISSFAWPSGMDIKLITTMITILQNTALKRMK